MREIQRETEKGRWRGDGEREGLWGKKGKNGESSSSGVELSNVKSRGGLLG